jgi:hypothetical protein
MKQNSMTLVFPGGDTRCIYSYSTPYAFQVKQFVMMMTNLIVSLQVIPGSSANLLFYLQGGGACWDAATTKAGVCTTDVTPQSANGVFNRNDARNKFKDYTLVVLSYCSGDVWCEYYLIIHTLLLHSLHTPTHSHTLTHSPTHSNLTHSLTHSLTH